jgi:hypothetical protein
MLLKFFLNRSSVWTKPLNSFLFGKVPISKLSGKEIQYQEKWEQNFSKLREEDLYEVYLLLLCPPLPPPY